MTLFVHIGRGKAGSSTLQRFAWENRAALRQLGLIYPDIGRFRSGHLPIAEAVRSGEPQPALRQLADELRRNPSAKYLISSEHLFGLRPQATENLIRHAGGHEVRIICYMRDYPAWIRSVYVQRTRTGANTRDFDAFFRVWQDRLSVLKALNGWAAILGWTAIRVRSLDPANLHGARLTLDLIDAVGLAAPAQPLPEPADQNIAPPWPVVELHRAMAEFRSVPAGNAAQFAVEKRIAAHLSACLAAGAGRFGEAEYLTPAQAETATRRFDLDVAFLNERTGSQIPPARSAANSERAFLPSFAALAPDLRAAFFRRLDRRIRLARFLPTRDRRVLPDLARIRDKLHDRYAPTGPGASA